MSVGDLRLSGLPHKKELGRYSGSINEQAQTVIYFLTGNKIKEPCGAILTSHIWRSVFQSGLKQFG